MSEVPAPLFLPPVTREEVFTHSVAITGTNVVSVECFTQGNPEENINVVVDQVNKIVTVSGNYSNVFYDEIVYIEPNKGVELEIVEEYVSDGNRLQYSLPYVLQPRNVFVLDNGNVSTNYVVYSEEKRLVFNNYIPKGNVIQFYLDKPKDVLLKEDGVTVVNNRSAIIQNIQRDKLLLSFKEDVAQSATVQFIIRITEEIILNFPQVRETILYQQVNNEFFGGTNFINEFYPSEYVSYKVIGTEIYGPGLNFFGGETYNIESPSGANASIRVSDVDIDGRVLNIAIDNPGSFDVNITSSLYLTYNLFSQFSSSNLVVGIVLGKE